MEAAVNTALEYLDFGIPLDSAWWRGGSSGTLGRELTWKPMLVFCL